MYNENCNLSLGCTSNEKKPNKNYPFKTHEISPKTELSQLLTSYIRFGLVLQLSWNPVPYQLEPCSNLSGTGFQLSGNNTIKAKMHKRSKHIAG